MEKTLKGIKLKVKCAALRFDLMNGITHPDYLNGYGKIDGDPETWAIDSLDGEKSYLYQSEMEYNHDVELIDSY